MQGATMKKPVPFAGCFTKTETETETETDATKTPWVFLGIADDTQIHLFAWPSGSARGHAPGL